MRAADCREGSAVYPYVLAEYEKYLPEAQKAAEVGAWVVFEDMRCYVVITAGDGISRLCTELFDKGEATAGLLVNTIGDEYVFRADELVSEWIKAECAKRGVGVKKRLETPVDIPLEVQREIVEKSGCGLTLTDGMQINPQKSLAYMLELTEDTGIFKAQHDCSKCTVKNCPRRTRPFKAEEFNVLAEYGNENDVKRIDNALCIDIGTTTVAFSYIKNGKQCGEYRTVNPQRSFGADVISRIEAANRGRLKELRRLIVFEILKGMKIACGGENPSRIIIAANTAMVHMLLGYSCTGLGAYPFSPVTLDTENTKIAELGNIPVTVIGGISAFVGGDIVSGIYASKMAESGELSLLADLGTNGEMALGNSEKILVTSTAAGPAFEGGGISCGTGSVDGAVCGVDLDGGVIRTIGDKKPCGICGTGIIELIAELLRHGIIDKTGLLSERYFDGGYPLTDDIRLTQQDIRAVQAAKSAVFSGIKTLLHEYGEEPNDVKNVYLAGGFGHGLNLKKAEKIGLLPEGAAEKAKILGNGALAGAVRLAADGGEGISRIKEISSDVLLGGSEYFSKLYIENMEFM